MPEQITVPDLKPIASRLETIMEQSPKEGYKAAIVIGVLGRIMELIAEIRDLAEKIKCIAENKGTCMKTGICLAGCGGLFIEQEDSGLILSKYSRNSFSIIFNNFKIEIKLEGTRLIIEGGKLKYAIVSGNSYLWDEVDLSDPAEIYNKNYSIKYATRSLGKRIMLARYALTRCAASSAIAC